MEYTSRIIPNLITVLFLTILQLQASPPGDISADLSHSAFGLGADPSGSRLPAGPYDLLPLLSSGDPIPGTANTVIERIFSATLNDAGQVGLVLELDDPTTPERERIYDLFVHDGKGLNRIVGTKGFRPSGSFELNENGTMAFFVEDFLVVANSDRLLYMIRSGDPAPVLSASGEELTLGRPHAPARFFNDQEEIVFVSQLSDGRSGIFRAGLDRIEAIAVEFEPIPGLPGQVFPRDSLARAQTILLNDSLVVLLDHGINGILVFSESGGVPLAFEGERILPGLTVKSLDLLDADASGRILFVANSEHLLLWTGAVFEQLLDPATVLPGLPGEPREIPSGYITPEAAVFFTVVREPLGGIFFWERGQVHKIAVDGDPSPIGDSLQISYRSSYAPFLGRQFQAFPRPASASEAVFSATIVGELFNVPIVWQRGTLLPIDLTLELVAKDPAGLLEHLTPLGTDGTGSILLRGHLCCHHDILFWAQPASPRTYYIPFLAKGILGSLQYGSTLEVLNISPFPAIIRVELFSAMGALLQASESELLVPSDGALAVSIQDRRLLTGYAKVTVENGATLILSIDLRLFEGQALLSRTVIPAETPAAESDLIVASSSGSRLPLAVTNPNQIPLVLELELRDRAGVVVDEGEIRIDEGQQASFYLSTIFPFLASGDFSGASRSEPVSRF